MDSLIYHNDRIIPLAEARLSPGQMGLLMGWGVFTTLRIYQGVPFAFDRHWERMAHDAERLGIALDYRQEAVWEAIVKLAAANHRPEGAARLSFIKNQGGMWADAPGCPATDLLIFTRELAAWPASHKLLLVPDGIFSHGKLAGAKMLSWVQNAGTLERVHAQGFDDALLLNEQGHLAECTSANVFLVRGREVLTPPLSFRLPAGNNPRGPPRGHSRGRIHTCGAGPYSRRTWIRRRKSLSAPPRARLPAWEASSPIGNIPLRGKSHASSQRVSRITSKLI